MTERVFIVREKERKTRIVRLEGILQLRAEPEGPERYAIFGDLMVGEPFRVVGGLGELETEDLLQELVVWLTHRGGMAFDVARWRDEWRILSIAGTRHTKRSIPRRA